MAVQPPSPVSCHIQYRNAQNYLKWMYTSNPIGYKSEPHVMNCYLLHKSIKSMSISIKALTLPSESITWSECRISSVRLRKDQWLLTDLWALVNLREGNYGVSRSLRVHWFGEFFLVHLNLKLIYKTILFFCHQVKEGVCLLSRDLTTECRGW